MRKLSLENYIVKVKLPDHANPGQEIEAEFPYAFKTSLINLLFIPDLQLSGAELVKQNVLAMKIETCKDSEILLEDEEYHRIKKAIDTYKGFGRNDVGLVMRVTEAEKVEVETKKPSR